MVDIDRIKKTASRTDRPFYLYDLNAIRKAYLCLRRSLPSGIDIYYALKANPHKKIVSLLARLGAGADAASKGEMEIALKAGIKPHDISFAGPGKTEKELRYAIAKGIGSISIENDREADAIERLSRAFRKRTNVSVRINPIASSMHAGIRMGGGSSQFGIDEESANNTIIRIMRSPYLAFTGVHMHTASQILSEEVIADNIRYLVGFCAALTKKTGAPVQSVNFGGGLGIPYYHGQKPLDVRLLGRMIRAVFTEDRTRALLRTARFVIEPGRYLVGSAGVYVTKILHKKASRGKTFLIVDGGMHQNLAAAGLLGEGLRRNRMIEVVRKDRSKKEEVVTIAGCLCTPLDILARDIKLPVCDAGDLIVIPASGAYGYSASPLRFLSHDEPREVIG